MEVFRGKSAAHAKKNATAQLEFLLAQHKDSPILFMVSGGSSLVLLEGLQISGNMTLTVLDERYSKDPAASNFNKLQRYEFFQNASHTLDVRVQENEPLEQFASRFEELLRNWKEQNPSGVVVATQGVAADGHTAGIMPLPEYPEKFAKLFEDSKYWVRGYDTRGKGEYPLRATVTLHFLREVVDYAFAYVVGKEKEQAVKKLVSPKGSLSETPGRILREMKHARLFTDIA